MIRIIIIAALCGGLSVGPDTESAVPPVDSRDRLEYGGVILEPGDVISFQGGAATAGGLLEHGHTSLYLGFDAQMQEPIFLDFSTTKGGIPEMVLGSPQAFGGRILKEREFLTYNVRWHPSFDVYRLNDRSTLDKRRMMRAAKQIAATTRYGLSGTVCSSAVSDVLSAATGRRISALTPDGFEGLPFIPHPQQSGGPIDIEQVLRDLGRIKDRAPQSAEPPSSGFLMKVAEEDRRRDELRRASQEPEIRVPDTSDEDAAREERRGAAWRYLKAALHLACSDPDDLRSLNDQRQTWGVLISRRVVEDSFARDRRSMSDCAQQIMAGVLSSEGPIDLTWVEKQGRRYYQAEQRRIRREQEAAQRAARAAAAKAEYVAAERGVSGESRSNESPGSSGSSSHNAEGAAYRQLISIAGGSVNIFDGH